MTVLLAIVVVLALLAATHRVLYPTFLLLKRRIRSGQAVTRLGVSYLAWRDGTEDAPAPPAP